MARKRSVSSCLWENEEFLYMSAPARLLWIGLWGHCDRNGVFEWRPVKWALRFGAGLSGVTAHEAPGLMEELIKAGFVRRYEVAGISYGYCVNWRRHQDPHVDEPPLYPMPVDDPDFVPNPPRSGQDGYYWTKKNARWMVEFYGLSPINETKAPVPAIVPAPVPAMVPAAPKATKKPKKSEDSTGDLDLDRYLEASARLMVAAWPKLKINGEPMPQPSRSKLRRRFVALVAQGYTVDHLRAIGQGYLKAYAHRKPDADGKPQGDWVGNIAMQAPQFAFGEKGTWVDFRDAAPLAPLAPELVAKALGEPQPIALIPAAVTA